MAGKLSVTQRKSLVGVNPSARGTMRALGLRHIGQTVELPDDPAVRGQIRAVRYLVEWEGIGAASAPKKAASKKKEEAQA